MSQADLSPGTADPPTARERRPRLGATPRLLVGAGGVPVRIAVGARTFGGPSNPGEGPPFLSDVTQNGLFIAFTALTVELPLFLPLAVGGVAGGRGARGSYGPRACSAWSPPSRWPSPGGWSVRRCSRCRTSRGCPGPR